MHIICKKYQALLPAVQRKAIDVLFDQPKEMVPARSQGSKEEGEKKNKTERERDRVAEEKDKRQEEEKDISSSACEYTSILYLYTV